MLSVCRLPGSRAQTAKASSFGRAYVSYVPFGGQRSIYLFLVYIKLGGILSFPVFLEHGVASGGALYTIALFPCVYTVRLFSFQLCLYRAFYTRPCKVFYLVGRGEILGFWAATLLLLLLERNNRLRFFHSARFVFWTSFAQIEEFVDGVMLSRHALSSEMSSLPSVTFPCINHTATRRNGQLPWPLFSL
ncbi:hypothetical protein IQ07DRAFT_41908 [Pyrenochaeta sp. DS3sAY3a]|nr:hypothetical protein IQ07DRAFT_41908 [Pyrenochaeta sp. DS3sAY3a]